MKSFRAFEQEMKGKPDSIGDYIEQADKHDCFAGCSGPFASSVS